MTGYQMYRTQSPTLRNLIRSEEFKEVAEELAKVALFCAAVWSVARLFDIIEHVFYLFANV